jgi:hypothetical protein
MKRSPVAKPHRSKQSDYQQAEGGPLPISGVRGHVSPNRFGSPMPRQ